MKKWSKYVMLVGSLTLPSSLVSCSLFQNNTKRKEIDNQGVILQKRYDLKYASDRKEFNTKRFDFGKYDVNYQKFNEYIINYDVKNNYKFDELFNTKSASINNKDSILPNLRLGYLDGIGDYFNFIHYYGMHVHKSYELHKNNIKISYNEYLNNAYNLINNNSLQDPNNRQNIVEQSLDYLINSDNDFLRFVFWLNMPTVEFDKITEHRYWKPFTSKKVNRGVVSRFLERIVNSVQQIYANELIVNNPNNSFEKIFDQLQINSFQDAKVQTLKSTYYYYYAIRLIKFLDKDFKIQYAMKNALNNKSLSYYDNMRNWNNSETVKNYNKLRNKDKFVNNKGEINNVKYDKFTQNISQDDYFLPNKKTYKEFTNNVNLYEELDVYDMRKLNDMMINDSIYLFSRNTIPNFQLAIEKDIVNKYNYEYKHLDPHSKEYDEEFKKNLDLFNYAKKEKAKLIEKIKIYWRKNARENFPDDTAWEDDIWTDTSSDFKILDRFYKIDVAEVGRADTDRDGGVVHDNQSGNYDSFLKSQEYRGNFSDKMAQDSLTKIIPSNKLDKNIQNELSKRKTFFLSKKDYLSNYTYLDVDRKQHFEPLKYKILGDKSIPEYIGDSWNKVREKQKEGELNKSEDFNEGTINNLSGTTVYGNNKVDQFYFDNDDFLNADHALIVDDIMDHFQNFLLPFGIANTLPSGFSKNSESTDINEVNKLIDDKSNNNYIRLDQSWKKTHKDKYQIFLVNVIKQTDQESLNIKENYFGIKKYLNLYLQLITGDNNLTNADTINMTNGDDLDAKLWHYTIDTAKTGISAVNNVFEDENQTNYLSSKTVKRDSWMRVFGYPIYKDGILQYLGKQFNMTNNPIFALLEPSFYIDKDANPGGNIDFNYLFIPNKSVNPSEFNQKYDNYHTNNATIHRQYEIYKTMFVDKPKGVSLNPMIYLLDAYISGYLNNSVFNVSRDSGRYYNIVEAADYVDEYGIIKQDNKITKNKVFDDDYYEYKTTLSLSELNNYQFKSWDWTNFYKQISGEENTNKSINKGNILGTIFSSESWKNSNVNNFAHAKNLQRFWSAFINKINRLDNFSSRRNGDEIFKMRQRLKNSDEILFENSKNSLIDMINGQIKDIKFDNERQSYIKEVEKISFNDINKYQKLNSIRDKVTYFVLNNKQDATSGVRSDNHNNIDMWVPRINRFALIQNFINFKEMITHIQNNTDKIRVVDFDNSGNWKNQNEIDSEKQFYSYLEIDPKLFKGINQDYNNKINSLDTIYKENVSGFNNYYEFIDITVSYLKSIINLIKNHYVNDPNIKYAYYHLAFNKEIKTAEDRNEVNNNIDGNKFQIFIKLYVAASLFSILDDFLNQNGKDDYKYITHAILRYIFADNKEEYKDILWVSETSSVAKGQSNVSDFVRNIDSKEYNRVVVNKLLQLLGENNKVSVSSLESLIHSGFPAK